MRVAAIDVGTNSTRLLVAEEHPEGLRAIERRMVITRLGQGVDGTGTLQAEALKRTLAVIADYAATCGELGVQRLRVVGTSAVRDAANRGEFFEGVKKLIGSAPELLSGEAEARTTFLGVRSGLSDRGAVLVVDIGGGSTELIFGSDEPDRLISLEVGCVRMFEKHLASDPPAPRELEALRTEVGAHLDRARADLAVPAGARLVGVAGTVTQLATLQAGLDAYDPNIVDHMILTQDDVHRLARRLASLPHERRSRVKGLEAGRVDVIVAGAEILRAVMEAFESQEILVSEKDILDGLVLPLLAP